MSSLSHHGIKGQRWGVRRFQNPDGTRTSAGKKQEKLKRLKKTSKDYASIKESLSDDDLRFLNYDDDDIKRARELGTLGRDLVDYGRVAHRVIQKDKNGTPITYVDANWMLTTSLLTGKNTTKLISIDLATRAGEEYRGKGYAVAAGKKMVKWFDTYGYKDYEYMEWGAKEKNIASQKTAEKLGFKKYEGATAPGWTIYTYEHKAKHTSIGGTMYIEGNALILGDSSYLEHHGIRGQRWGVRRFQNRDGSLTNAGRKRLGYATKGAAQTVGKAFKAGVKVGGNAVKAAKAHHEKKEAEKLQKKKEKASKTRLGVMANKDLFTNEEIRKLNERFKLEDEMKMATLQKGVEIAKAVGTIAQNVGTVAKTYEDVTGQSLSPIKRKAAEEKARQDKEDRERRIAREDADEARKAAKEERDIAIHEQTLRKAIAAADTQEFTAQKTKAEADSSVLDAIKKGQDFNGGSDATGQSWMEKAKNGGKNPFDDMIANRDPEYAQIRKEHDEKVARKERIAELERREKEREAEKAAARKQSAPQQKQGGGDDDALFSQKGSLPIDKDRYKNNRAMEKAKQVKEDAAEERAKKQDEKAVNRTIDDTIEANRSFKEVVRAQDPHAYDRGVAKDYIKGKLNNLPNALADLNPINRAAKKIADKATKEEEAQVRKSMKDQYDQMVKNEGRDEANYVMYNTRVANLQAQGYSERKAKQIADSNPTFSAKRNRKKEYYEKVGELESTHRKNAEELHKANKELTDYYYKLINGPGYDPGTPKREALDRTYRQKRGELERLEKDNNEMLEKGTKEAKKILEHSFSIQNGVLFIDSSDGLAHHGVKGQRWGVSGTRMRSKKIAKYENMLKQSDMEEGMYHVENGTLFINADEPYLEHHGVKGMKWGKHLMAGKGVDAEGGGGGGFAEDDEKLKEMAKKAGMSVAEYKQKFASKLGGAAAKAKKEIGYVYGSEYKKDFERAARLHENNSRSMREQAKAAWEGYGESRTAAQRDNWKRYAEYDRQAKASGNMFVKRERSKRAYDNSLASKVDSAKRKARLTQDKAKSKISDAVDAAKKTRDDVKDNIRSKTGIGVKKDIERNARLAEGQKRRAHELTKQVYSAKNKEDWARAYSESNKESFKALDNERKVKKDTKSYPKSIAGRVDSTKRKVRLTKDRLKSTLGKSKQRKQLSTVGPKAKKQISNARDDVEKAARSNEAAYKHATEVYRQTGRDSDAYRQAIKRSQTTLWRSLDNQERLKQKKRRPADIGKKRAKHFDDTNAIYTEGTRLVVNSKWG